VRTKAVLSWSGGKDSSLALYETSRNKEIEIVGLLTTITKGFDRISMHGVRRSLLLKQAESIGLPLYEVFIPKKSTNEIYEREMRSVLIKLKEDLSATTYLFGDIFLQDIREYREKNLSQIGMDAVFPLWGKNTRDLARYFISEGFRAVLCTLDPRELDPKFCGREFDDSFLSEIPSTVDPCGENGEFHTFVYEGPIFTNPIKIERGEVVERDGFYFADLLAAKEE
jgi:uncharacterized protein (TIGR00290 family)